MCGGGGGGAKTQKVEQTTTTLPDWAEPYYRDLLTRTAYQTSLPYETYTGQRLAYFTPAEQEGMAQMVGYGLQGTPQQMWDAMNATAGTVANPGILSNVESTYTPGGIGGLYGGASRSSGYHANSRSSDYDAGSIQSQYNPEGYSSGYLANQMDQDRYSYIPGSREVAFDPGTLKDFGELSQYMSPYYQAVVDVQKREAARQADMRNTALGLESAQAGGPRGNYRLGLLEAENERNLGYLMNDIQKQGSESAFLNAQQAFEADRTANIRLEELMQSQFGLNQDAAARAAQLYQQGWGMNEAARQAQEELAQGAYGMSQSASQAAEQFRQGAFGLTQGAQQTQEQLMQSQWQANEAARQAQEQFAQSQFGMNQQAAQAASQIALQAYQAQEQAKQQAQAFGLQAAQINQAGQIAANQVIQGGAAQLAELAGMDQAMTMEKLNAVMNVGAQERALIQQGLDTGYQDYLRQQGYPLEMLSFYNNIMQGNAIAPGQTTTIYGEGPTTTQQALGAGIAGLGLYKGLQ